MSNLVELVEQWVNVQSFEEYETVYNKIKGLIYLGVDINVCDDKGVPILLKTMYIDKQYFLVKLFLEQKNVVLTKDIIKYVFCQKRDINLIKLVLQYADHNKLYSWNKSDELSTLLQH